MLSTSARFHTARHICERINTFIRKGCGFLSTDVHKMYQSRRSLPRHPPRITPPGWVTLSPERSCSNRSGETCAQGPADEQGVGLGRKTAPRPVSGSEYLSSAGKLLFPNTHTFTSQQTVYLSSEDHSLKLIHAFACLQLLTKGDE